ncbi:MAG: hypothetical protein IT423_10125 [Pirellulaceae bacterium]|nr:hypothetical protein [Pirellulaceae bacterium]
MLACLSLAATGQGRARAQEGIDAILKIQRGGGGVAAAHAAAEKLIASGSGLESLLGKAGSANPVAKNWLLSIAQAVADRQPAGTTQAALERILANQAADGEVRYWALDRLAAGNTELREKLLDGRTEDSSLDIRFEAIQLVMKKLPSVESAKADEALKQKALVGYQQLLKAARQHVQVNAVADVLKELGVEVNRRQQFGFISNWQVVGPFDNRKEVGFDTVYKPEDEYARSNKVTEKGTYPGKGENSQVGWQPVSTDKPDGSIDLNPVFLNEKGAVVYAFTTIDSPADLDCQVRFGSPNANKIWVNGKPANVNNVYHTGSQIDQYVAPTQLKRGANTVLLKLCQNEQTEAWAQDFSFMVRFTDETGLAIPVTQAVGNPAQ